MLNGCFGHGRDALATKRPQNLNAPMLNLPGRVRGGGALALVRAEDIDVGDGLLSKQGGGAGSPAGRSGRIPGQDMNS